MRLNEEIASAFEDKYTADFMKEAEQVGIKQPDTMIHP